MFAYVSLITTLFLFTDKLYIHLVPNEALHMCESPWQSRRHQSVGVVIRDELCGSVRMGGHYTIIGLPTFELAGDQKTLLNTVIEVRPLH